MDHRDHVRLIEKGIPEKGGVWADFGSGDGAFTLALRDRAEPECEIYSIDKEAFRIDTQKRAFARMFRQSNIHYMVADFTCRLPLPPLDGIIMANSLHFFRDKAGILTRHVLPYLKPGGTFILVEYNTDTGNIWVPYPLSYPSFRYLATAAGLAPPRLLDTEPSGFLNGIYAAQTTKNRSGISTPE